MGESAASLGNDTDAGAEGGVQEDPRGFGEHHPRGLLCFSQAEERHGSIEEHLRQLESQLEEKNQELARVSAAQPGPGVHAGRDPALALPCHGGWVPGHTMKGGLALKQDGEKGLVNPFPSRISSSRVTQELMTFPAVISPSPRHPSLAVSVPHPLLSQRHLLGQAGAPNAGRRGKLQLLCPPAWISSRARLMGAGTQGCCP